MRQIYSFPLPQILVKTLAKNLVKSLPKSDQKLVRQIKWASRGIGRSVLEISSGKFTKNCRRNKSKTFRD